VQLYNGRAVISIQTNGGKNVVSAKVDGMPTNFITIN
jgi:beta-galactosidase